MSYEKLTPAERSMVDFVMRGDYLNRNYIRSAGRLMGIADRTVKNRMGTIFRVYGISRKQYLPVVRLVYLRGKELGLIR